MIEALEGRLVQKLPHRAVISVGGMSFDVHIPFATAKSLPESGESARILCHLHWREDGPQLFGFASEQERAFFRLLTRVNKIGPKLALNIMSSAETVELAEMILSENLHALTSLKGVGGKLAARLIVELKEPLARLGIATGDSSESATTRKGEIPFENEVRDALDNLGYMPREINRIFKEIGPKLKPDISIEEIIGLILRSFSSP